MQCKNLKGVNVMVFDSHEELSEYAAEEVVMQVKKKLNSVLGLATGGTPLKMYKNIVKINRNGLVDFSKVITFNLDEYYPIAGDDKNSYRYYMWSNFLEKIGIDEENVFIPNGEAHNVLLECETYDENINSLGGIDLQILGIGNNGHIGFNEPSDSFQLDTHLVRLDDNTIKANARFFNSQQSIPSKAITMGIHTIFQSKKIMLLATGKEKEQIIFELFSDYVDPKLPASILKLHNNVSILLDKQAANKLLEVYF